MTLVPRSSMLGGLTSDRIKHGAGGQEGIAWVCALMQRINATHCYPDSIFHRYFLRSGTNHRLASYFARLIGAMQVTHGSNLNLLKI